MRNDRTTSVAHGLWLAVAIALALSRSAAAHTAAAPGFGLQSGFLHPVTGLDHLVAMVAVGLWGAQLGSPAIWALPIAFPLIMTLGGVVGIAGAQLPFAEAIVALSGIVLGVLVALRVRLPLVAAVLIVGTFAIFHGYAHGRELPQAADPLAYAIGFVVATGMLHVCGILIGLTMHWPYGEHVVRACGVAIGGVGLYFLVAAIG
jgi:urease accessory protein